MGICILANLKCYDKDTVTYYFGAYDEDITGEVIFGTSDNSFEILKQPEKYIVFKRSVIKLFLKYKKEFAKGIFREKICFQS